MTRFENASRARAAWIGALLAALIVYFALSPPQPPPARGIDAKVAVAAEIQRDPDLHLYRTINAKIAQGQSYYEAAAETQRIQDYPLRPFITVRLPTLAWLTSVIGPYGMLALLWTLAAAVVAGWWRRFDGVFADKHRRVSATMLVTAGVTLAAQPQYAVLHELWAGMLVALALALHRDGKWWPSVVLAILALLVRELVLPVLFLMIAYALARRSWREAAGWIAGVAVFGVAMAFHAQQVALVVGPGDPASPGWGGLHGPGGWLRTIVEASALRVLPAPAAGALAILALFGWTSWRSQTGALLSCLLFGYGLIFSVLGRPENFYWGLIVTPVLLAGLAFVPAAFADLRRAFKPVGRQLDMLPG